MSVTIFPAPPKDFDPITEGGTISIKLLPVRLDN
jgi:hypothetical protein